MRISRPLLLLVVLAVLASATAVAARPRRLTVKVAQGKLHGTTLNSGRVRAFLGIPYAAPPVGNLRWQPPQPAPRWHGARDATRFRARCMSRPFSDMVFRDSGPSEDCLFLNVYAPAKPAPHRKLPVMFWIHGGGFQAGSASEPRHSGDVLPTRGVILVTINYRLGVFGFLTTSDLAREQSGAAGNYGLMDMVAALRWVHANIAAFGGDPANVTIFGESAGSEAVCALMAAAPARGLFAKAIGESGGALDIGAPTHPSFQQVEQQDDSWAHSLAPGLAHLRALPAEAVLAASLQKNAPRFWPLVDGRLLTEPVAETYAAGRQAHVPLLAGWNRDEQSDLSLGMTPDKWKEFAQQTFAARAPQFLTYFPAANEAQAVRSAINYQSDVFIVFGTWQWINAHASTGDAPVFRYRFDLPSPPSRFDPGSYAFHSDDIEYVFGTLDTRPEAVWRSQDRQVSDQMMSYWTNFACHGDPNGAGLPKWPRFDTGHDVLHFTSPIAVSPDTTEARYQFLLKWMPRRQR